MIIPVILAGGAGSRLWPLSRETYPKQFIPLFDGESLFHHTLSRCEGLEGVSPALIITNEEYQFLLKELLAKTSFGTMGVILEPAPRSTAPAIAVAAFHALAHSKEDSDPLLLVLPADHLIEDTVGFQYTVLKAMHSAQKGALVTFGIKPSYPETGYGYIQAQVTDESVFKVEAFIEKPALERAETFVQSEAYFWNSGMFLFRASVFLQELSRFEPELYSHVQESYQGRRAVNNWIVPEKKAWEQAKGISIDYAVMERTDKAAVLPLQSSWHDVGSWLALSEVLPKDLHGNTKVGDVHLQESENCLLFSERRLVAAVGVKNLVVIETPDVVLVADKEHSQLLKPLVSRLKQQKRIEATHHQRVHRPWGSFESIDKGVGFQVKRISVNIGASLSLQMHHHRSEHWVVVCGTARVTRGEDVFILSENQSTYIPIGTKHRLENIGKMPLEIIEVQSGSYLGEDDIVRFEDQYGRQAESAVTP